MLRLMTSINSRSSVSETETSVVVSVTSTSKRDSVNLIGIFLLTTSTSPRFSIKSTEIILERGHCTALNE